MRFYVPQLTLKNSLIFENSLPGNISAASLSLIFQIWQTLTPYQCS